MNSKHPLRWLTAMALAVAMLVGLSSTAAASVSVEDTDRVKLTSRGFDFGYNWDGLGAPLNGGWLDWWNTSAGTAPVLTGYLYMKNVSNDCAKVQVVYYDRTHGAVDLEESTEYCASSNALHKHWIYLAPAADPDIDHVHVKINTQAANGQWITVVEDWYDYRD